MKSPKPIALEPRLRAVAEQIQAEVHADIGSDHALLPQYLLQTGRVGRVVAVEKHRGPYERSRQALEGWPAEVRLGDGLEPVREGEVHSLSLSGLGTRQMVKILTRYPQRVPVRVVLQPNNSPEELRGWAQAAGFHLIQEAMVEGFWPYTILGLERRAGPDPAYQGLPQAAALRYGPLLLRAAHPLLLQELRAQQGHLERLRRRGARLGERLETLRQALACL